MKDKIYFKNFNAIRAIAAIAVLISHIEADKSSFGLIPFTFLNLVPIGTIAVTLFFVLSGFLITYLLLSEHILYKKINLKHFYLRRILRIWPLYFVVFFVGCCIFYSEISLKAILFSLFFLPNIPFANHELPSLIDPIWSIGIEEQFYIFFPLIFLFKRVKTTLIIIATLIIISFAIRFYIIAYDITILREYFYLARFDCMLIGAIGAFISFNYKKKNPIIISLLKVIYSKLIQFFVYLLIFIYLFICLKYQIPIVHQFFAILFVIMLINLGTNNKSIINLENKFLNRIGVVSYGIYLTHGFTNMIVLKYMQVGNIFIDSLLVIVLSIIFSILLANISYYYFEIFFINLKEKLRNTTENSKVNKTK
ncbi:MAG: hypothetical protein A2W98_08665 [Bacteroidetes bacterium GWF2_33_38]|nr:MAG: hypothetical protein A2W98_08665 [Bacteroidetes bacterium GWF2_33_38]OFY75870.1 MAG: hypothetical protein A2265_00125 [Bacteroidetes bacterium RIFOXYA12_FULL_33_9]